MRTRSILLTFLVVLAISSLAVGADKYVFDIPHSSIGFSARHLVISNTKGEFNDFTGTILFDEKDITKSSVEVIIKAGSIDTDNEKRDNHLKSADFLEVEKYPEITFMSTSVKKTDNGYELVGNLTIHGVTKEVSMPFTLTGPIEAFGSSRIGIEASLTINRQDFGVKFNKVLEGGGLLVSNEVKISLEVEAVKAKDGTN